jgi:PAT family acetyl-CoA transporter-like MFS transporter 1
MDIFLKAIPARLIMGLVIAWLVWVTPSFMLPDGQFPMQYYVLIVGIYMVHQVIVFLNLRLKNSIGDNSENKSPQKV